MLFLWVSLNFQRCCVMHKLTTVNQRWKTRPRVIQCLKRSNVAQEWSTRDVCNQKLWIMQVLTMFLFAGWQHFFNFLQKSRCAWRSRHQTCHMKATNSPVTEALAYSMAQLGTLATLARFCGGILPLSLPSAYLWIRVFAQPCTKPPCRNRLHQVMIFCRHNRCSKTDSLVTCVLVTITQV